MKNKLFKISILTIILMMCLQICIFASTLKLNIKADKEKIEIGEEVKVTVSWDKGMQAADFSLVYDSKKLEYVGSDLEEDFVNNEDGEVKTAWFSLDNTDKTEIEYTFKAIKSGRVKFSTKINGGFATGELQIPEEYENAKLKIKVLGGIDLITIIIIIIFILAIFFVISKRKSKSRNMSK